MSDITAHHVGLHDHVKASSLLYRVLFALLFTVGLATFALARLIGRSEAGSLIAQARQAAHASAGYAVRY